MNQQTLDRTKPEQKEEDDCLLKKKEAARVLGISTRTFDRLVTRGLIQKIFVGGSRRYSRRELREIGAKGV